MNDLEQIRLNHQVKDSLQFQNNYEEMLNEGISQPVERPLLSNLEELYNSILVAYEQLTNYQITILQEIFKQFVNIQEEIDPNRIKDFSHYYNEEDEELLLYRKNKKGLINIIIHDEELFAFSYIDDNNKVDSYLDFYEEVDSTIDYEKIVLKFFS